MRRLDTDRIDLYQLHFPDGTPLDETLGALDELVRAGKVREIGCSNFSADQIDEAEAISREKGIARYVSVQNEYSMLRRGPERFGVLDACARNNVAFLPYFPLASGMLTGKYKRNEEPPAGSRPRRIRRSLFLLSASCREASSSRRRLFAVADSARVPSTCWRLPASEA